jgi:hypothetical protein
LSILLLVDNLYYNIVVCRLDNLVIVFVFNYREPLPRLIMQVLLYLYPLLRSELVHVLVLESMHLWGVRSSYSILRGLMVVFRRGLNWLILLVGLGWRAVLGEIIPGRRLWWLDVIRYNFLSDFFIAYRLLTEKQFYCLDIFFDQSII